MTDTHVTHDQASQRYVLTLDGQRAGHIDYTEAGDTITLTHTEVAAQFQGGGNASTLVRGALEDLARRDLSVVPACPYVARWLQRHQVDGLNVVGD